MRTALVAAGLWLAAVAFPAAMAEAQEAEPADVRQQTGAEQEQAAATVEMTNSLRFVPSEITVRVGDTVEWRNTSQLVHTVTADPSLANDPDHVQLPDGAETFNSGNIPPGETFRHTFEVAGTYEYVCLPHEMEGMRGTVVVREEPGEAVSTRE